MGLAAGEEPNSSPLSLVHREMRVLIVTLQILTVFLLAIVVTTTLAHVLELPGKLRVKLKGVGLAFFKSDPFGRSYPALKSAMPDETHLRDRWEYSHVARAIDPARDCRRLECLSAVG